MRSLAVLLFTLFVLGFTAAWAQSDAPTDWANTPPAEWPDYVTDPDDAAYDPTDPRHNPDFLNPPAGADVPNPGDIEGGFNFNDYLDGKPTDYLDISQEDTQEIGEGLANTSVELGNAIDDMEEKLENSDNPAQEGPAYTAAIGQMQDMQDSIDSMVNPDGTFKTNPETGQPYGPGDLSSMMPEGLSGGLQGGMSQDYLDEMGYTDEELAEMGLTPEVMEENGLTGEDVGGGQLGGAPGTGGGVTLGALGGIGIPSLLDPDRWDFQTALIELLGQCDIEDEERFDCKDVDVNCQHLEGSLDRIKSYITLGSATGQIGIAAGPKVNRATYFALGYDTHVSTDPLRIGTFRPPAYELEQDCEDGPNKTVVSEPCGQDNRWRDACLMGWAPGDIDYWSTEVDENGDPVGGNSAANKPTGGKKAVDAGTGGGTNSKPSDGSGLNGMELSPAEAVWPGVRGIPPFFKPLAANLNCTVPKSTPQISTVKLNDGWMLRNMCPGLPQLSRVERDEYYYRADIFRGVFNCFAPLPKCKLDMFDYDPANDKLDPTEGKGQETLDRIKALPDIPQIQSPLPEIPGLTPKQKVAGTRISAAKRLFDTEKSRAPECKPAYWVRLMMDSCANQFIVQKSAEPDYVFIPDGRIPGVSPRQCQPMKTVAIIENDDSNGEEYNPHFYLKLTAQGLLYHDYFPAIKMPKPNGIITQIYAEIDKLKPEILGGKVPPKIFGLKMPAYKNFKAKGNVQDGPEWGSIRPKEPEAPSINDYAKHGVERIVDAYNPFTPRWHFETHERRAWADQTATMLLKDPRVDRCAPLPFLEGGYFEYGKCTVYCSAVPVDMLVFRRNKFDNCMRCQIGANEWCFWSEVRINDVLFSAKYIALHPGCWIDAGTCLFGDANGCEGILKCKRNGFIDAMEAVRYDTARIPWCWTFSGQKAPCPTRIPTDENDPDQMGNETWCTISKLLNFPATLCMDIQDFIDPILYGHQFGNVGEAIADNITTNFQCFAENKITNICHKLAQPIYGVNMLKIRPRVNDIKTNQPMTWSTHENAPWKDFSDASQYSYYVPGSLEYPDIRDPLHRTGTPAPISPLTIMEGARRLTLSTLYGISDDDAKETAPPAGYDFETYFGPNRPYMRWWDTGKESFQEGKRPDYWCDWGRNDTVVGVGMEGNSIQGGHSKQCRYGGSGGVGDDCFKMDSWQKNYPGLAGSEWAELKMYQANCFRRNGLNCLCQNDKFFKQLGSEEQALASKGGEYAFKELLSRNFDKPNFERQSQEFFPLGWRGYASDTIEKDAFPNLHEGADDASKIEGGLDKARAGDILVWPGYDETFKNVMPHVALVVATNNAQDWGGDADKSENWVRVTDSNYGKYPDACGNTSYLGYGPPRRLFKSVDGLPVIAKELYKEQVVSTYSCNDGNTKDCVEEMWNDVKIFRSSKTKPRTSDYTSPIPIIPSF